jgi:hypothetical protein
VQPEKEPWARPSSSVACLLPRLDLLYDAAPSESIGGALDAAHPDPVIFGIAARVAGNNDMVARLQQNMASGKRCDVGPLLPAAGFSQLRIDAPVRVRFFPFR